MKPIILISREQYERGVLVGRKRQDEDDLKGLKSNFEMNENNKYLKHEIGALCELAFWKFRFQDRPWIPAPMKGVDVDGFQVRGVGIMGVPLKQIGLPIRRGDRSSDFMALVIQVSDLMYVVRGWISIEEGRRVGTPWNPGNQGLSVLVQQWRLREFLSHDEKGNGRAEA